MTSDIKMIQGDCKEVLKTIPDKSIDLIITDPPYNLALSGGGAFGKRNYFSDIVNISDGIDNELLEVLVSKLKKINMYIYCNKRQILQYLTFFNIRNCMFDLLTWHKTNPVPTISNKYLQDTEYILFFREQGVKVYGSYATKKTYYISSTNKADKKSFNHPTVKPLDQSINFITNSSVEGDTILDPFAGTGTVGVACKKLNRNFIGIELDEKYYNTALGRLKGSDN